MSPIAVPVFLAVAAFLAGLGGRDRLYVPLTAIVFTNQLASLFVLA